MSANRARRSRQLTCLLSAVALVAACSPAPTSGTAATEGHVSADAYGNTHISLGGRNFVLKPYDGRAIGNLSIQIAGQTYSTLGGAFNLPATALKDFQSNSRGFFRVFASGYVPVQVWIGQQGDDVPLVPILAVKVDMSFPSTGGVLSAPAKGLAVTIPPGILTKPTTPVQLSTYVPPPKSDPTSVSASLQQRTDFLSQLAKLTGGKTYTIQQTSATCTSAEKPLPCPPATAGLGVLLTINGQVQPGTITSTLDLDVAGKDPANAAAVARILQTFSQIDADPEGPAIRKLLQQDYGVTLVGHTLSFSVNLATSDITDGYAKIAVAGMDLLGVNMEFTVVSAVGDTLPPQDSTPGLANSSTPTQAGGAAGAAAATSGPVTPRANQRLISNDGSSLISQDGGTLISQDGGTLISQDGGSLLGVDGAGIIPYPTGLISQDGGSLIGQDGSSLISQDGGSLISQDGGGLISNDGGSLVGHVTAPFAAPGLAKFGILDYTEYPWPQQAQVRAVRFDGTPLSRWVTTDLNSNYYIYKLPPSPAYYFVEAILGNNVERAGAMAPGKGQVVCDITGATTAVSSAIFAGLVANQANQALLSPGNINADVGEAFHLLDQPTAQSLMTMAVAAISTKTWSLFNAAGVTPLSFGTAAGPAPAPATGTAPASCAYSLWASDATSNGAITFTGGSNSTFAGSLHSEGGIAFSGGSNNSVTGQSEYVTTVSTGGNPLNPIQVAGGAVPAPAWNPASLPTPIVDDATGTLTLNGSTIAPGVYRSTGTITLSASGVTANVTLVAPNVNITGGGNTLTAFTQGTVIHASSAFTMSGCSNNTFNGLVEAADVNVGGGSGFHFNQTCSSAAPPSVSPIVLPVLTGVLTLSAPAGALYDKGGDLIVADYGNHRLVESTSLLSSKTFSTFLDATGTVQPMGSPCGLVYDGQKTVYFCDPPKHAVYKWIIGNSTPVLFAGDPAVAGQGGHQTPGKPNEVLFTTPYALTINPANGHVLVADAGAPQVVDLNPAHPGAGNLGSQYFYNAADASQSFRGIAVDPSGNVLVSDYNGNQIVIVKPDNSETTLASTGLAGPEGLLVSPEGFLFIAENTGNRLDWMPVTGGPLTALGGLLSVNGPRSMSYQPSRTLVVTDSLLNLVKTLKY